MCHKRRIAGSLFLWGSMTIEQARKMLGKAYQSYTNQEIERFVLAAKQIALACYEKQFGDDTTPKHDTI